MSLITLDLIFFWLLTILITSISKDNSVKLREIYVFCLRIVCQRNWILILCTLAEFGYFLLFMTVIVVRLRQAIC